MSHGFLPRTDNGLLAWSRAFGHAISSSPPSEFGLTQEQCDDFNAKQQNYADLLAAANNPTTRTAPAVAAKNQARAALRVIAGVLNRTVQANPNIDDAQRTALRLTVPAGRRATPVPAFAPNLTILTVTEHRVRISLQRFEGETMFRGRPGGACGAIIFSHIGEVPPTEREEWKFQTLASRTSLELTFPPTLAPGTRVWLTAMWLSPRLQMGPASTPICTNLQGGGVGTLAAMRLAA